MVAECVGAASLAIWLYLLLARGKFWKIHSDEPVLTPQKVPARRVAVIVPARDEAATVGKAVSSLLQQDYTGELHTWLVDDHSSDGTADVARRAAREAGPADRLTVIKAAPLQHGWTGKLWALSEGLKAAPADVDYYLFTDADIVHAPGNISSLVARAESGSFDLVSSMVKLKCETLSEKLLIPAFTFFFFMLYPPAWVQDPRRSTAAAAGGCMLIRRQALARIGGVAAIRDQLIDDCALARALKPGGRITLAPTSKASSTRHYGDWGEVGRMISRTAFTQLRYSIWILGAVVVGMVFTYLAPPLLLGFGFRPAALGAAAWLLMSVSYLPSLRFNRLSKWWAPLLPLIAAFYLGATVYSALEYWRGRGGSWKGRHQAASAIT